MNQVKKPLTEELHEPALKNFLIRKVEMREINKKWQADRVNMVTKVLKSILVKGRVPKKLHIDWGSESQR